MDNSVKGNATEKAMELGLDDLEAITGAGDSMSPETFATLYEMDRALSIREQEASASKKWDVASSLKTTRLEIRGKIKDPTWLSLLVP